MSILRELFNDLAMYVLLFKQKTAYEMRISDWSSDVCSSDLTTSRQRGGSRSKAAPSRCRIWCASRRRSGDTSSNKTFKAAGSPTGSIETRSEERRVGKE